MARGRPREFDSIISVRLTKELHEALVLEAIRRKIDVSDLIRERLVANFRISNIDTPPDLQ